VALDAALPAAPRTVALARGLTARVGLTLVVLGSFAVRAVASAAHPVPRYFPDEYIYTAIARSLGAGHAPAVRSAPAHFPALLGPILAAPLQALFAPGLAYRLTQCENALVMSLAAVPVYLLARRLTLSARYALACAVFAVAIPDLLYASYTLAGPAAYPLALSAVAAGVAALERPTRRAQLLFLGFTFLAMFARVQFVVLPVAFVAAALVVDRRSAFRTQRLPLVLLAAPALAALAVGGSRILGYYSTVTHLHVGGSLLRWAAADLFLLSLVAGVVLVPGAVAALARPRGRTETAFAAFAALFAAALLFEAGLYASNGSARFQERYLFSLLPLVPVAFGLYVKHGRPLRTPVTILSLLLFAAIARVPLSGYTAGLGRTDSPFLVAVFQLERLVGTATASVVVALAGSVAAVGSIVVARRGGAHVAVAATVLVAAVASVGAIVRDASAALGVRDTFLPANASWVDATGLNDVTLVQTADSPSGRAIEQLYWNRSVTREALLGPATATDIYPAPHIRIARDGTLGGVHGNVLVQDYGATARFSNAVLVARAGTFSLYRSDAAPRLSLLEAGRFSDGWLARTGRLSVWPDGTGRTRGTLRFTLSLPADARPVTMHFGKARYRVEPGRATIVTYTVDARGKWSLPFKSGGGSYRSDLRAVSVRSTPPLLHRYDAPSRRPTAVS
jgi:hypothetical protein